MAGEVFQTVMLQIKDAADCVVGVTDEAGVVVACTDFGEIRHRKDGIPGELSDKSVTVKNGCTYMLLPGSSDYAAFVNGSGEVAAAICRMAAVALGGAKAFHDEKHDNTILIKKILTDNILPGDIYAHSRELSVDKEIQRAVLLVHQPDTADPAVIDVLQNLFPAGRNDFVISINERDTALVKELTDDMVADDLLRLASALSETISSELYIKTVIGIGTAVSHIKDLAASFKEAQTAIDVGQVFEPEKSIIHYGTLGIGRLIYQLPTTLCEMFLTEVFKKNTIESLDQETLFTILKFFENNLNVSETSRKLFVHRNTLVYRIEKIKKLTGLDLREFDHAIIFKVALMVKQYLATQGAQR
ncbi:MAG: helix-turn-helix domain-containing protein [Oscillospiraceae bacterium]|nr:helix-turn-helix domain-containing protein [Oscillospiraceae bacterium]